MKNYSTGYKPIRVEAELSPLFRFLIHRWALALEWIVSVGIFSCTRSPEFSGRSPRVPERPAGTAKAKVLILY